MSKYSFNVLSVGRSLWPVAVKPNTTAKLPSNPHLLPSDAITLLMSSLHIIKIH